MNTFIKSGLLVLAVASVFFTGCGITDDKPPRIYLVGSNDTTIIMREKYVDPGYYAEDNVTKTENIILANDLADKIIVNSGGYTTRNEVYEIIYTATDEAGNSSTITRTVRVQNMATPLAGSYTCFRRFSSFWGDTTYRTTVAVDNRIAGRLRINKVYNHWDPAYHALVYFKIYADLWAPDLCTTNPHFDSEAATSGVGYQGLSNTNNSVPWYRGLGYDEAYLQRRFEYIHIPTQVWADSLGNANFLIQGSVETDGFTPKSKIEYIGTEISKIILKYNITNQGVTPAVVDQVTEEYTPYE
ncbi:MAG TPA: DUF5011 domain-containing protein [Bacteroidales bacterium]|nr:DUF5011 domain-containing protein [Bacteroidales bacterium]HQL71479.1 DUF5011 domain-containing protein [Bacteroidales bacterium]